MTAAEQVIAERSMRGFALFEEAFGRKPDEQEMRMILLAVYRHYLAPNAPTQRLQ